MKYFDTHSHLNFPQYADDRDAVLERMEELGVWTITVGTAWHTSEEATWLAEKHKHIFATIGVHPTDSTENFDGSKYQTLLTPKVVGVGECGFDYFRKAKADVYAHQRMVFEAQIDFAIEHDLPLMLHVRASRGTQDAHEDALALLSDKQKTHGERVRGNAHFFTGSCEIAKHYWDMGFSIAVPGVITFTSDYNDVVREAPPTMLLSETDAPYAAPEPYRGKRNEPSYVVEIVKAIAKIREEKEEEVRDQLFHNACRVFNIPYTSAQ